MDTQYYLYYSYRINHLSKRSYKYTILIYFETDTFTNVNCFPILYDPLFSSDHQRRGVC